VLPGDGFEHVLEASAISGGERSQHRGLGAAGSRLDGVEKFSPSSGDFCRKQHNSIRTTGVGSQTVQKSLRC
jgi:hypothetical protein